MWWIIGAVIAAIAAGVYIRRAISAAADAQIDRYMRRLENDDIGAR